MNDPVVLEDIPFELDTARFLKKLHLQDKPEYAERARELARQAGRIARPRAMYRVAYIESKGDDTVVVDGITLTSRVLRVNLDEAHRVFPFVATCGRELQDWSVSVDDMLEHFWADIAMEMALRAAVEHLKAHIAEHPRPGPISIMNPGSLKDWPLEQQRELFRLLGEVRGRVGVELTDSFLMVPVKSVSGLCFPAESRFENCQLCPREPCPGRRAPYDPQLYERRYSAGGPEGSAGR